MFCKSSSFGLSLLPLGGCNSWSVPLTIQYTKQLFRKSNFLITTPFTDMFLTGNLRVHSLEWDCSVGTSSLLADTQWISFVLESTLWKRIYLVCKMWKNLNDNYNYFAGAVRYQSSHKRHQSSHITYESLSCSLYVCFLYNTFGVNSQAKGS